MRPARQSLVLPDVAVCSPVSRPPFFFFLYILHAIPFPTASFSFPLPDDIIADPIPSHPRPHILIPAGDTTPALIVR